MKESIEELRKTCLEGRYKGEVPGLDGIFYRRISTYITKILLILGVSPNQVTVLSAFPGILAGLFLLFEEPQYWILSALLINLFLVLDCCDGEVARYTGRTSNLGGYLDLFNGLLVYDLVIICMTFGIHRMFNKDIFIFILGFLILLSTALTMQSELWMEKHRALHSITITKTINKKRSIEKYGRFIFGFNSMFSVILILVALLDMVIAPFTFWFLTLNARYAFFVVYALAILIGTVQRNYFTMKNLKTAT